MSYALFASGYTYGPAATAVKCPDLTAAGIKAFFHKYADPGEQIRYTRQPHSIVFLGEDDAGKGFYSISYNGGRKSNGTAKSTSHNLFLQYITYEAFAKTTIRNGTKELSLAVWDTNGGSYSAGTAKSIEQVRTSPKITTTVVRIACPVEAAVQYEGETLDSSKLSAANPKFTASFGTVERDSTGAIVFELKDDIDYELEILGTGEGTMDLTLEYRDETGVIDTRKFEDYPVTSSTVVQASGFDPRSSFVLYGTGNTASGDPEVWGAGSNETINPDNKDANESFSSEHNSPDPDITLDVSSAGGRGTLYGIDSPFGESGEDAYVYIMAALYDSSGKLREIAQQKIERGSLKDLYTLQFQAAAAETDSVKVLLLDQSYKPLREAHVCSLTADTE